MLRKLTMAGIAVLLALSASAALASVALAAPTFTAPSYPSTTSGSSIESYVLTTGMGKVKCGGPTLAGEQKAASSELTLSPVFSGCVVYGLTATISLNGCDFTVKATTTVSENMVYSGTLGVACPAGKSMEFAGGGNICIVSIPAQTGVGTVEFEDQTGASPEDIVMKLNITKMKYMQSGSLFCPSESFEDGIYTGGSTLKSLNGKSEAQSFMIGGK